MGKSFGDVALEALTFGLYDSEPKKPKAPKRPGPAPDLTDEVIWAAQRAEMLRQRTGRTRQSTFLTQPTSLLGG